ncbi:ClpP/crotonase-like domain-containing protein [Xylariomycetidae sp. FL2044]|nr:ClpP/crotonase-like domain-containing protein [Xylariomycetidae sp. FL2044]
MADTIKVSYAGRVATITIDNEPKLGALTGEGYFALAQAMREVAAREDVYITVLTGKGRYFSAGADVSSIGDRQPPEDANVYESWLRSFAANNLNIAHAFYTHPKILVVALNGPAVGLSAALTAHADFVYAAPHAFLLTPFSSLGLVAEGASSVALSRRLGPARAAEALIMSRRITCEQLVGCGYVNAVFDAGGGDGDAGRTFLDMVMKEVHERLGDDHLVGDSLTGIKALLRAPDRDLLDRQNVAEVFAGLDRFVSGVPQREFLKVATGKKRHKL